MKKTFCSFVSVGTLLILLGAGCASSDTQPMASNTPSDPPAGGMKMTPQIAPELTTDQQTQLTTGTAAHLPTELTFDVHGSMFYFVPNIIHVKKGDKVKIVFHNDGGFHDFLLDEFNVTMKPINGGETATVEFTADKVGSFEYYCGVGNHRAMGQKGTLVVE